MAPSAFSQNQWVCVIKDVEVVKGTLGIELLLTGQGHLICIFCLKAVWNEKKKKKVGCLAGERLEDCTELSEVVMIDISRWSAPKCILIAYWFCCMNPSSKWIQKEDRQVHGHSIHPQLLTSALNTAFGSGTFNLLFREI